MFIYRKFSSAFISLSLLTILSSVASAAPYYSLSIPRGFYVGAFGGGGHAGDVSATQNGVAFFGPGAGGPLAVNATGDVGSNGGIVGMHVGYEWGQGLNSIVGSVSPAVELEGFYLRSSFTGDLNNPTTRLPEHSFSDTFPMNTGVLLVNGIINIKTSYTNVVTPYLGAGVGTARMSVVEANSSQIAPPEANVNHFNSDPNATGWTFAAQAKLGLHINLTDNLRLLAEYRMLYLDANQFSFGSTQYPTHVPTTKWNVNMGNMVYNMGVVGIEYSV